MNVASEVDGRVAWVSPNFANGGSLSVDETFIRIDPAEFELHVEAAEMAVREAAARVAGREGPGPGRTAGHSRWRRPRRGS